MNIIIFDDQDVIRSHPDKLIVGLRGQSLGHINEILRLNIGDNLRIGKKNGNIGQGTLMKITANEAVVEVSLTEPPPPKLPLTLALALPRPLFLRRIISAATSLGMADLVIFQSYRVEKSYWRSPVLLSESMDEAFRNGLEQACDTVFPGARMFRSFGEFTEDVLGDRAGGPVYVAHPRTSKNERQRPVSKAILVIGPEGGFVRTEIETFQELGCHFFDLGERIVKVETAVVAAITKLCL